MPSPHRLRLTWWITGASAGLALALIRLAWLAGTDAGYEAGYRAGYGSSTTDAESAVLGMIREGYEAGYRSAIQDAYAEGLLVPEGPEPVVLDF